MDLTKELPAPVVELLGSTLNSEFATVSGAGVPIDTPMFFFPSDDMSVFNVATGTETSLLELCQMMLEIMGRDAVVARLRDAAAKLG